jgi:hypothetical protein
MGADYLLRYRFAADERSRLVTRFLGVALLIAPLVGSFYALNNLYTDPSFAKNDFRSMIHYVESRAGENDVVLYNNAILLPLHEHYQTRDDLPVTALPVYPHSAEGVEGPLADLAQTYDRIWFMTDPPADDRDLQRRVASWLSSNLQDVDNKSFHAKTTVVHSTSYRTESAQILEVPSSALALDHRWSELPSLRGIETGAVAPSGGETLWLDLFWQGNAEAPRESEETPKRPVNPTRSASGWRTKVGTFGPFMSKVFPITWKTGLLRQ